MAGARARGGLCIHSREQPACLPACLAGRPAPWPATLPLKSLRPSNGNKTHDKPTNRPLQQPGDQKQETADRLWPPQRRLSAGFRLLYAAIAVYTALGPWGPLCPTKSHSSRSHNSLGPTGLNPNPLCVCSCTHTEMPAGPKDRGIPCCTLQAPASEPTEASGTSRMQRLAPGPSTPLQHQTLFTTTCITVLHARSTWR